jgi:hypothetical protein
MDKPKSLSVKDYIIRKMSIKLNLSEKNIDAVITHQFQSAASALSTNDSLEISGFGKLLFNKKKAIKKMEKLMIYKNALDRIVNDETLTEQKRRSAKLKLETVEALIESLKPKNL